MSDKSAETWPRWRPLLRRADQACVAAVVAMSLIYMAATWLDQRLQRGGSIDIETAPPLELEFRVDVNRAPWTELTLLPGIGETLAKRIVVSRESHGPFATADDLRRVRGIGPKTLERIRPYLAPMGKTELVRTG